MAARKGNRWWEKRSSHGRKPKFETPSKLWEACTEYFEWVEDNPLTEEKIFHAQGVITKDTVTKMRAMTINGLCIFLDITEDTLTNYQRRDDFFGIVTRVKNIIRDQKFTGAAADLLNPNIIARDLGLADNKKLTGSGEGGAIKTESSVINFIPVGPND